jgi:glycosyltransferase involved in cell wall biosynthesis
MNPTVSVVLPTHNGSRFIDQSIESVISQTFTDWELIVVDDSSTDDTPVKIAFWMARDPRIRRVTLRANRKLPAALNEGFRHARGGFLTWTSDDNWYHPTALECMLDTLKTDEGVDIVYTQMDLADSNGHLLRPGDVQLIESLPLGNCVGACFLFRAAVFRELTGYDESTFLAEDYDFWLRAWNRFRFKFIQETLYSYRVTGELSTKKFAIAEAVERVLARWVPTAISLDRKTKMKVLARISNYAFARGDYRAFRAYLLRAIVVGRKPLLYPGSRSRLIDFVLGRKCGDVFRLLSRQMRLLFIRTVQHKLKQT